MGMDILGVHVHILCMCSFSVLLGARLAWHGWVIHCMCAVVLIQFNCAWLPRLSSSSCRCQDWQVTKAFYLAISECFSAGWISSSVTPGGLEAQAAVVGISEGLKGLYSLIQRPHNHKGTWHLSVSLSYTCFFCVYLETSPCHICTVIWSSTCSASSGPDVATLSWMEFYTPTNLFSWITQYFITTVD